MGYIEKFLVGFVFDFCLLMSICSGGIMLAVAAGQYEAISMSWGLLVLASGFWGLIGGVSAARKYRQRPVKMRIYGALTYHWIGSYIFKTSMCFMMFAGVLFVGLVVNYYFGEGYFKFDRRVLLSVFLSAFIPAAVSLFILERFPSAVR